METFVNEGRRHASQTRAVIPGGCKRDVLVLQSRVKETVTVTFYYNSNITPPQRPSEIQEKE